MLARFQPCRLACICRSHFGRRNADAKYRGSEEILAACDICYHVKKDDVDTRLVKLDQIKNRVAEEQAFRIRLANGRFKWED